MAELVDAVDSKSAGSNPFRVRFSMSVTSQLETVGFFTPNNTRKELKVKSIKDNLFI